MKKRKLKKIKEYYKTDNKSIRDKFYYELETPKWIFKQFKIDSSLVKYFIEECKKKQVIKQWYKDNTISPEQFMRKPKKR
tara:strand:+ start:379 stop:618 length:240 start_codon:yes stop_codon:yes gene_type:complete